MGASLLPMKNERQRRPEICRLALRFSVEAKVDEIFWSVAPAQQPGICHSPQLGRKARRMWADQFNAGNLTQPGRVLQRLTLVTRRAVGSSPEGEMKQHRLGENIRILGHLDSP